MEQFVCIAGTMDTLSDAIVQHILSLLRNARDVAACACVSRRWKEAVPDIPSLYFPRHSFGAAAALSADAIIGRMVHAAARLEELVVYCPFSAAGLASWLALCCRSLRVLELRMDGLASEAVGGGGYPANKLECIGVATGLEALKLWGVSMARSPNWGTFECLGTLEIVGATLRDATLRDMVRSCPNITDLSLLGCYVDGAALIELHRLVRCRLDFLGPGNSSLHLNSPRLEILDIQGFSWISIDQSHCIRWLCIARNSGRVYRVHMLKLADLEFLSLRGVQWSWSAISSVLKCASEVKHLVMKIEFCGDFNMLHPFPEIDLVEFFNDHPALRKFEVHGALFAALCQKNSLKNLDSKFIIPCLEEIVITVRSPLNAEQKLDTLESLLKHTVRLRSMAIRITQMKYHEAADGFFKEICKLKYTNHDVMQIE